MAWGDFVRNGGTNGTTSAGSTLALTVPAAGHAAGNIVVVSANSVDQLSSVSDTGGNTWSTPIGINNGTSSRTYISWSQLTTALVSGNTITCTFAASNSSRCATSEEYDGGGRTVTLDKSATSTGSSGTVSTGTTAAQTGSDDLSVCAFGIDGAATEYSGSPGNSYTTGQSVDVGTNTKAVRSAWKKLTDASATSSTQVCGFTENWAGVVLTLQGASLKGAPPFKPLLPTLSRNRRITLPLPGFLGDVVAPAVTATSETPTPGGAVAAGFGPVVQVPSSTGGAVADGVAPTARVAVTQGGAVAAGTAPTAQTSVTQGGAPAAGNGPSPAKVDVAAGGAIAGGFSPTDGSAVNETPTPGGAIAGGNAPSPQIPVSQGGAVAAGNAATVRVTLTIGGATAAGNAPVPSPSVVIGGASTGGFGATARVSLTIGGATAGGYAPFVPGSQVPASLTVSQFDRFDVTATSSPQKAVEAAQNGRASVEGAVSDKAAVSASGGSKASVS